MNMRSLALVFFAAILLCCNKHQTFSTDEGVITGTDLRGCPCVVSCPCACGGFIFHFTDMNDTSRTIIDNMSIILLPPGPTFPIKITVDWQNTSRCGLKAIKVLSYTFH
jgi:hypothetical protein